MSILISTYPHTLPPSPSPTSFRNMVLHHLASLGLIEKVIYFTIDLQNSLLGQSKHLSEKWPATLPQWVMAPKCLVTHLLRHPSIPTFSWVVSSCPLLFIPWAYWSELFCSATNSCFYFWFQGSSLSLTSLPTSYRLQAICLWCLHTVCPHHTMT